jgi:D-alanyl-D-alanine carboxypeptidase (penicillin-binding protein 5/6)
MFYIFIFLLLIKKNIIASEKFLKSNEIFAIGSVLMDSYSGRILWEKNYKKPLAMASTTKIMTAIFAIEKSKNLDKIICIDKSIIGIPKVKMDLVPGEKIELRNLLYALMLQSSNDAAVAIAKNISGSVDKFCEDITKKAKKIGAENTVFKTPNGLDKDDHHSTAYDMAKVTRYALKNKKFIDIINTPNISFKTNKKSYLINNKNRLLKEFKGANGVKTGFTGKAGNCFVGSAKRNGMQLISVVLGSGWGNSGRENKWTDTKKILNYGFENFAYKKIFYKNQIAARVEVLNSRKKTLDLIFNKDLILPLCDDDKIRVVLKIPDALDAPIIKNKVLGKAIVFINNKTISELNLISNQNIARHDFKNSIKKIFRSWIKIKLEI